MRNGAAIMSTGGLLAVVAVLFSVRPTQQPRQVEQSTPAPAPVATDRPQTGRQLLEAFTGTGWGDVGSCGTSPCELDIMIATLPDPFDSALDWGFDAYLEAIRRAYEAAGYITDRFYLPGRADSIRVPVRAAGDSAAADSVWRLARDILPGVVLFRPTNPDNARLRLLYVVYEIPTSGIHREAMATALAERDSLLALTSDAADPRVLRILGPTFSGSARSLAAALRHERDSITIISGTATDTGNVTTFGRSVSLAGASVRFESTVHPDVTLFEVLGNSVLTPLGICPEQVAVLRETTSQYSVLASQTSDVPGPRRCREAGKVLDIAFPMNIASLRSEYAESPEAQSSKTLPTLTSDSRVRLTLRDPARRRRDIPPTYSSLTPAALEQSFAEIVRTLRAREVRLVVLLGTDVRDKVFLARELRKELRDVRLVTFESNALYLHRPDARDLRGMLVLSTYPLILENQRWSADRASYIAFGSEGAVGVYNAASVLLGNESAVVEYGQAVGTVGKPPVWITAIGRESLLPVRAVNVRDSIGYVRAVAGGFGKKLDLHAMTFPLLFVILSASLLTIGVSLTQFRAAVGDLERANLCATSNRAEAAGPDSPDESKPMRVADIRRRIEEEFERRRRQTSIADDHVPGHDLVEDGSLLIRRRLYALWVLIGAAGITLPLLALAGGAMVGIAFHDDAFQTTFLNIIAGVLIAATALAAVVVWVAAVGRTGRSFVRLLGIFTGVGLKFAAWDTKRTRRSSVRWLGEILLRGSVTLAAPVFLALVLLYAAAVFVASFGEDVAFTLFFHRAMHFDGGLSPILTLGLVGGGMLSWGAWHGRRIRLLLEPTPFEQALEAASVGPVPAAGPSHVRTPERITVETETTAFNPPSGLTRDPASGEVVRVLTLGPGRGRRTRRRGIRPFVEVTVRSFDDAARERQAVGRESSVATVQLEEPECGPPANGEEPEQTAVARGDADEFGSDQDQSMRSAALTVEALVRRAHEIRQRLFYAVPPHGWAVLMALGLVFVWLVAQLGDTLESVAAGGGLAARAFAILHGAGLVSAIAVTAWCTYRLRAVWEAATGLLVTIADTPLLPAFGRLPSRLAHAARFRLLPRASEPGAPIVARQYWQYLARVYRQPDARVLIDQNLSPERRTRLAELMKTEPTWRQDCDGSRESSMYVLATRDEAEVLCGLSEVVAELWSHQPTDGQIREEASRSTGQPQADADSNEGERSADSERVRNARSDRLRRRYAGVAGLWLEVAEEFLAAGVTEYVQRIQAQMRNLGWFLLVATLLGTALLSSYPFEPQALFKILFLAVLIITVVSLVMLVTEMNRNEVLSQIDRTKPGEVTWNTGFVLSLVFYGAVPIIAVLSSQFGTVRDALFAWVEPLMHTIGKF